MVVWWLLTLTIVIKAVSTFLPVAVEETCTPTVVVKGPCHICVCGFDGIYQCKRQCSQYPQNRRNIVPEIKQCEPDMAYMDKDMICTCSKDGQWKVGHCIEKFGNIKPIHNYPIRIENIDRTCTPGDLYLIDCNICRCSGDGVIETALCSSRRCNKRNKIKSCTYGELLRTKDELCGCSDINVYIDRLCIKVENAKKLIINSTELAAIFPVERTSTRSQDNDGVECIPPKALRIDCNMCFCTKAKAFACTDRMCVGLTIQRSRSDSFFTLPVLAKDNDKCIPGIKYRMNCNTCTCSDNSIPICTTMFCLEDVGQSEMSF